MSHFGTPSKAKPKGLRESKAKYMAKGAKRKPTKVKRLKGTERPSRVNPDEPTPDDALPQAPGGLEPEELAWFQIIVGRLDSIGVASATDSELITMIARRLADIDRASEILNTEGSIIESFNPKTQQTLVRAHPANGLRNEAMRHLQALLAECGLTPASRSKVSAKPKQKAAVFSKRPNVN